MDIKTVFNARVDLAGEGGSVTPFWIFLTRPWFAVGFAPATNHFFLQDFDFT